MTSQPQSIVHHVLRLGKIAADPIAKHSARRRRRRRGRKGEGSVCGRSIDSSCYSDDGDSFFSSGISSSRGERSSVKDEDQTMESSSVVAHRDVDNRPEPIDESEIENFTVTVPRPHYGEYKTIDQNQFFVECMLDGECSSIVHFFDEKSSQSFKLDMILSKLSTEFPHYKFLRIDGAWTQFVAAKLMITSFPAVLAIRNKVVLDRLANFDEMEYVSEDEVKSGVGSTIP